MTIISSWVSDVLSGAWDIVGALLLLCAIAGILWAACKFVDGRIAASLKDPAVIASLSLLVKPDLVFDENESVLSDRGGSSAIKENGIIQPITVRKRKEGGYEILAGERRWRAAQSAGLHEVPAIIKSYSDREALQVALIENIQREDLDPIEEAESYARLIEEFSLSQNEAAEKVGKERSSVANALRLLGLPPEIRTMLTNKEISTGHAKAILAVPDKIKQTNLAKKVVLAGLSVRALEAEIKANHSKKASSVTALDAPTTLNMDLAEKLANELADQLQKSLGTKVEITYKSGKGRVQVSFYSDDQLTELYEKLKK